ncbi:hypothetical protein [Hoeflea poritis]|uniref:Uncharacterized protein n=1 Tax=Hoeflea poritis TaxID=2993659 RepID=A0ABT4VUI6_9HYPH|nr:hypothetical protein [Hoeflea poritis]MDA4848354.1 hypothetical protein [Hoeflea poritis]
MLRFDLVPYVRVGPIEFGETQASVIEKLGPPYKVFHRHKGERELTLSYRDLFLFVDLDQNNGNVEAVIFYGDANFFVEDVEILKLKNSDAIAYLKRIDILMEKQSIDLLISRRCGIAIRENNYEERVLDEDDDEDETGSVLAFAKGYY